MMYSDYLALSVCAYSILYVPFMIIAQLRFSHILQCEGYDGRRYFVWMRKNFWMAVFPLIGLCAITIMAQQAMHQFLYLTIFFEYQILIGFVAGTMLICIPIAIVFYQYIKQIKIENEFTPLVCSRRLVGVFVWSSIFVCAITLVENTFPQFNYVTFLTPLVTPFLVPLANVLIRGEEKDGQVAT